MDMTAQGTVIRSARESHAFALFMAISSACACVRFPSYHMFAEGPVHRLPTT